MKDKERPSLTAKQVLEAIEQQGSPNKVDLSRMQMTGINLSSDAIRLFVNEASQKDLAKLPWVTNLTWQILPEGTSIDFRNDVIRLDLKGANLNHAIFIEANLSGAALMSTNLYWAYLLGANLSGCNLYEANLKRGQLQMANFENASLIAADLRDADVTGANFRGANFEGCHLEEVDLRPVASLEGAFFNRTLLSKTQILAEAFGRGIGEEFQGWWREAREVYIALKNNFIAMGRYKDASWAYVKERRMEGKTYFPTQEGTETVQEFVDNLSATSWLKKIRMVSLYRWYLSLRIFLLPEAKINRIGYLLNRLEDFLCGYGEQPIKVLRLALLMWAVFPILYWISKGIARGSEPAGFLDSVIFSFRSSFAFSFDDLQPIGIIGNVLAVTEVFLGLAFLALLMYTLGKRMSGR